jgi:hypothetical protein
MPKFEEQDLVDIHYDEIRKMGDSDVRVMELHEGDCQTYAVLISFVAFLFFVWVSIGKLQWGV